MTLAFAAGSFADNTTDWTILVKAAAGGTYSTPVGPGTVIQIGTSSTAGVNDSDTTKDTKDGFNLPPVVAPVAQIAFYRPDWQLTGTPSWGALRDYKTPLTTVSNLVKTWDNIVVWATPGYSASDIHLLVAVPSPTFAAPESINGQNVDYKFVMTHMPSEYTGPTEFVLPKIDPATATSGQQYLDISLPVFAGAADGAVSANPISGTGALAATLTNGYAFNFVTPEPGSFLALGAGLVSFAGLIRRRRTA